MFALAEQAPLSWHPVKGGNRALIAWDDDETYDLGSDGPAFDEIANRMLGGNYYPPDALVVFGRFQRENRRIQVGDRLLQRAPLFRRWGGPKLFSAVEIIEAERTATHCAMGYVTTVRHHGRGIWHAVLTREGGQIRLHVWGTAMPQSWLFWLGLPIARATQRRAWRRAVEEFRRVAGLVR